MVVIGLASLVYGIFDISQGTQILGVVKLLLGVVALALGAYYLRKKARSTR
jgi:hypothetical protein